MTIRVFREVIVVMILVAGGAPGSEPQATALPTRAEFELVRQLHRQTESLYSQGRLEDALAIAERAHRRGGLALARSWNPPVAGAAMMAAVQWTCRAVRRTCHGSR